MPSPLGKRQAAIRAEPSEIGLVRRCSLLDHHLEAGDLFSGQTAWRLGLLLRTLLDLWSWRLGLRPAAARSRRDEEGRLGLIANERSEPGDDLRRRSLRGLPHGLRSRVDLVEIRPGNVQLLALSSRQTRCGLAH